MSDTAPRLEPGVVLQDTYRIVRRIGQGGMGEVYEVVHARLSGRYAVKFLLGELGASEEAFARFRREAEVTSALRHPCIVQVIDFNRTQEGAAYLVMEYLEGSELSREIQRAAPFEPARVATILAQTASGLAAAHRRGIVHRDLKPDNLFLVRMEDDASELVKILDFGISKVKEATIRLTRESAFMGTPHYMSPEQALGRIDDIDPRSDQFSLGAIVYEMLAGREPFQGDNLPAIIYQVVHEMPARLSSLNPAITPGLEAIVMRALAKKPADRYPDVRTFAQAFAAEVGVAASELTPAPVSVPSVARKAPAPVPALSSGTSGTAARGGAARNPSGLAMRTTLSTATAEIAADPGRDARARRRTLVVAAGAIVLVGVILIVATRTTQKPPANVPASSPATSAIPAAPAPVPVVPDDPPAPTGAEPEAARPLVAPRPVAGDPAPTPPPGKTRRKKAKVVAAPAPQPSPIAPPPTPAPEKRPSRGKLILDF